MFEFGGAGVPDVLGHEGDLKAKDLDGGHPGLVKGSEEDLDDEKDFKGSILDN